MLGKRVEEPTKHASLSYRTASWCWLCFQTNILTCPRWASSVIPEESEWMQLQTFKIAAFKCSRLKWQTGVEVWMVSWLLGTVYLAVFLSLCMSWQKAHVNGEEVLISGILHCYYPYGKSYISKTTAGVFPDVHVTCSASVQLLSSVRYSHIPTCAVSSHSFAFILGAWL